MVSLPSARRLLSSAIHSRRSVRVGAALHELARLALSLKAVATTGAEVLLMMIRDSELASRSELPTLRVAVS